MGLIDLIEAVKQQEHLFYLNIYTKNAECSESSKYVFLKGFVLFWIFSLKIVSFRTFGIY